MKNYLLGMLSAVLVLGLSSCGWRRNPEQVIHRVIQGIEYRLDLNQQQKEALASVEAAILERRKNRQPVRLAAIAEFETLMKSEKVTADQLRAPLQKVALDGKGSFDKVFERLAVFHSTLDDKQRAKIVEKIQELKVLASR